MPGLCMHECVLLRVAREGELGAPAPAAPRLDVACWWPCSRQQRSSSALKDDLVTCVHACAPARATPPSTPHRPLTTPRAAPRRWSGAARSTASAGALLGVEPMLRSPRGLQFFGAGGLEACAQLASHCASAAPALAQSPPPAHTNTHTNMLFRQPCPCLGSDPGPCRAYDLLILEDDPYFYLQFPEGEHNLPGLHGLPHRASYLSLDVDGRVLRYGMMKVGVEWSGGGGGPKVRGHASVQEHA